MDVARSGRRQTGQVCLLNRLLLGRRPLDQLDASAPRIGDIGELDARLLVLPDRLIELDALGLDLLGEGLQVLHVEADVVKHAPFGGSLDRKSVV